MGEQSGETELDPAYVAGLLDATGRVRFDISETGDGTYTVRPMLRIDPSGTQMREAVIGQFLESRGYRYEFIEREYGRQFFRLQTRTDLDDLESYLEGQSAHLVRELEFTNGVFAEVFDFDILEPADAYRFLLARNDLRHGWRPRGRYHVTPSEIAEVHEFDADEVEPPSLPVGSLRADYSVEWLAGVFDGLCRYRPNIARSDDYANGYSMYPITRLHRAGIHSTFVTHVMRFCNDYDLNVGDSCTSNTLNAVFTGSTNIRRVLDVLFPRLLVLAEHSAAMVEDILPRFDRDVHHEKQGFYELLRDFQPVARASGGPFRQQEYDPEYFADLWRDDLDLTNFDTEQEVLNSQMDLSPSEEVSEARSLTVSLEDFPGEIGRYQSLISRSIRDGDQARTLQSLYDDRCQVCGKRRATGDGTGYSEIHHLKPLAEPHGGSDATENMLVVCPNHQADLDNGVLRIGAKTQEIDHPFDSAVDGEELTVAEDHELAPMSIEYHNQTIHFLRSIGPVDQEG